MTGPGMQLQKVKVNISDLQMEAWHSETGIISKQIDG